MDFFTAQDKSRQKTKSLLGVFGVAVVFIVVAIYAVTTGIWMFVAEGQAGGAGGVNLEVPTGMGWWDPVRALVVTGATLAVILGAMALKTAELAQGGGAVAKSVGGRRVEIDRARGKEKMLLNVVEEMAIASGVPVPEVYVLEEEGINAFAAGFTVDDAAVAVTRGALDRLTRQELQGVVAHEFSHILNGDMRLNIRLAGLLFGILVIAILGSMLVRSVRVVRVSNKKEGGGIVLLLLLGGAALWIIGSAGVLCGRLIQAMVSRQREFLADASAVQFTRDPGGIAGALKKIGGWVRGSRVEAAGAMDLAHLFFGNYQNRRAMFLSLATHPPLEDRIRAIEPDWDGKFLAGGSEAEERKAEPGPPPLRPRGRAALAGLAGEEGGSAGKMQGAAGVPPAREAGQRFRVGQEAGWVARAGQVTEAQVGQARELLERVPEVFAKAREGPMSAQAAVLSLILSGEAEVRERQLAAMEAGLGGSARASLAALAGEAARLAPELRLPVLELLLPATAQVPPEGLEAFLRVLRESILADQRVDFREFIVHRLVKKYLHPRRQGGRVAAGEAGQGVTPLAELAGAGGLILSFVLATSMKNTAARAIWMKKVAERFPEWPDLALTEEAGLGYGDLDRALDRFGKTTFAARKRLLEAILDIVQADRTITLEEAEVFRALALSLDCPMAPLQAGVVAGGGRG